ncbi:MAG: hypothetical protein J1F18_05650 [Lachnospiraceae bacterium]|nr:hypothetical protein [Lachnospiraceae bacterium]
MKEVEDIIKTFETDSVAYGAMYILPDGRMLNLSVLQNGHAEFWVLINSSAQELKALGWLRLNTKLKYVEKPKEITAAQAARLESAMAFMGEDVQIK